MLIHTHLNKGIGTATTTLAVMLLWFTSLAHAEWEVQPAIEIGKRDAEFSWTIAGNRYGTDPNILSELTWRNLKIDEFRASVRANWDDDVVLRGYWNDGDITAGDNQDSDYAFDNRQGEFSRSNNQANSGSTLDQGFGVGIPIHFSVNEVSRLTLMPMFGFSHHEQNLRMRNGLQTVSDPVLADNEGFIDHTKSCYLFRSDPADCMLAVGDRILDLNSSYQTEWDDFWFGADFLWKYAARNRFHANAEYHIADYYARANWNLRDTWAHPVSFVHWSSGTGIVISLGWDTQIYKNVNVGVGLDWQQWIADPGVAQYYGPTGGVVAETRFNGAEWRSTAIFFHLGFQFNSI